MNSNQIILVGGGGHCKSCIDVIEFEGRYKVKGIIDLQKEFGKTTLGYEVIGNDDDLPKLANKGFNFLVTLGHMGNSIRRIELFNIIKANGGVLPTIISPKAQISKHAVINEGTILMHHSIVNADVVIGKNCIINSKALIEHDVIVGNDCHISTDVNINGNCKISNDVFIGSSATLKNGIEITNNVIVGMGSIVIESIEESGIYFGNPTKKVQ